MLDAESHMAEVIRLAESNPLKLSTDMLDELYSLDWDQMRTSGCLPQRWTRCYLALGYRPLELTWLMDHGLIIDNTTIKKAVLHGGIARLPHQAATVSTVIKRHGNADAFRDTRFLATAARRGQVDVVRVLLEAGLDPNEQAPWDADIRGERSAFMPLYDATEKGKTEVVRLLLMYGADPKKLPNGRERGETPFQLAERRQNHNTAAMMRLAVALRE